MRMKDAAWIIIILAAIIAGCNTIYVMTGSGHKVEDNNSVERKVDIDKSRDQVKEQAK